MKYRVIGATDITFQAQVLRMVLMLEEMMETRLNLMLNTESMVLALIWVAQL